ncbi:MAG: hypothetical protein JNN25_08550 [Candidatus Kapabacteria bacterium]|nr:hypothetical protein [Candidatus Kapabacteria bacterium]
MKLRQRLLMLIFLTIATVQGKTLAQEPSFGQTLSVHSQILHETRIVRIYAPPSVQSSLRKYPVLYVLDGESLMWSTLSAAKFLTGSISLPQMPEAIIVSISNTNRDRDMPVPQVFSQTKGAENFLRFLTDELVSLINKRYAVSGLNVLIGHSQGGLFASFAAVKKPNVFCFILALDAPMTVDSPVLQQHKLGLTLDCQTRYVSMETLYGWGKSFSDLAHCKQYSQHRIEGETHESMPHKGIYEGLKILFRDYLPPESGLPLAKIQEHYAQLSKQHHCTYTIPSRVLFSSATQHINQSKKQEALALLRYAEQVYGKTRSLQALMLQANAITKAPDGRIDFYLHHPPPTAEQLHPFQGKWKGVLNVPGGTNTDIIWHITKTNNHYFMESRVMDSFTSKSDFLFVNEKNQLVWGRKHNGGGIYLSIGTLSDDGLTITGTEDLIGFEMPKGFPPFKQNSFRFQKE